MSTQSFFEGFDFELFLLDRDDADVSDGPERWRLSSRILFCAVSGASCWMIIVRLAGALIGT